MADNGVFSILHEAMYPGGTTGAIPGSNTSTAFSIPLGALELPANETIFDAQTATVLVNNNGTAKTINAATLTFSDTSGASISYALSGVSVASGASTAFTVNLTNGMRTNATLLITFASAPTVGSADIQAALQGGGIAGGSSGGTASSVALNDGTTTSQKATVDGSGNLHVTDAKVPATGQATMTNSLPVVIASNQTAIPISGSITASNASIGTDGSAIPASSTLIGASDGTNLQQLLVESASNRNLRTGIYSGANEATVTGANALKVDGSAVTQPVSGTVTANAGSGNFTVAQATPANLNATATIQATTGTGLAADQSNSVLRVSLYGKNSAAGDTPIAVDSSGHAIIAQPTSATGTLTSVAATTSNTQLLASNAARKGAYFYNDGGAIMYLAFNATASTTSYTAQVPPNGFFEMPTAPTYTGQINAVWSTATGNARITEMS